MHWVTEEFITFCRWSSHKTRIGLHPMVTMNFHWKDGLTAEDTDSSWLSQSSQMSTFNITLSYISPFPKGKNLHWFLEYLLELTHDTITSLQSPYKINSMGKKGLARLTRLTLIGEQQQHSTFSLISGDSSFEKTPLYFIYIVYHYKKAIHQSIHNSPVQEYYSSRRYNTKLIDKGRKLSFHISFQRSHFRPTSELSGSFRKIISAIPRVNPVCL